jgi:hypothetical protein
MTHFNFESFVILGSFFYPNVLLSSVSAVLSEQQNDQQVENPSEKVN